MIKLHELIVNRGYRSLILQDFFSGIGDSLYNIVFVVYASSLPFKTLAVSLASLAGIIPSLLEIVTGYYADRSRKKVRPMIGVRGVQTCLFVLLAIIIRQRPSIALFLLLLAINIASDTIGQFANGLQLPILKHLVSSDAMDEATGLANASHTTIQIVFQGVGATLIVLLSYNYSLFGLINALTFLMAALVLALNVKALSIPIRTSDNGAQNLSLFKSVIASLKFLITERGLFYAIILAAIFNFFGSAVDGLVNLTLLTDKPLIILTYGISVAIFSAASSVGSVLGAFFANDVFRHFKFFSIMLLSTIFLFLVGLVFLWGNNAWLCVCAMFGLGYFLGKNNARLYSFIVKSIPDGMLGRVSGAISMLMLVTGPLGQVVFIGLANTVDTNASWMVFVTGGLIFIGLTASMVLRMQRQGGDIN